MLRPGSSSMALPIVRTERLTRSFGSLMAVAEVDFREYPTRLEPGMVMQLTIPLPYDEPAWA